MLVAMTNAMLHSTRVAIAAGVGSVVVGIAAVAATASAAAAVAAAAVVVPD